MPIFKKRSGANQEIIRDRQKQIFCLLSSEEIRHIYFLFSQPGFGILIWFPIERNSGREGMCLWRGKLPSGALIATSHLLAWLWDGWLAVCKAHCRQVSKWLPFPSILYQAITWPGNIQVQTSQCCLLTQLCLQGVSEWVALVPEQVFGPIRYHSGSIRQRKDWIRQNAELVQPTRYLTWWFSFASLWNPNAFQ